MDLELINQLEKIKLDNESIYSDLKSNNLLFMIIKYTDLVSREISMFNSNDWKFILSEDNLKDKDLNTYLLSLILLENKNFDSNFINTLLKNSNLNKPVIDNNLVVHFLFNNFIKKNIDKEQINFIVSNSNLNHQNDNGNTPLMLAMLNSHTKEKIVDDSILLPLIKKSNLNLHNNSNKTSLSIAISKMVNWESDWNLFRNIHMSDDLFSYVIHQTDSSIFENKKLKKELQKSINNSQIPKKFHKELKDKFKVNISISDYIVSLFKFKKLVKNNIYLENKNHNENILLSINDIKSNHLDLESFNYLNEIKNIYNVYKDKNNIHTVEMKQLIEKIPNLVNVYLSIEPKFRDKKSENNLSPNELLSNSIKNIFDNILILQKNIVDEQVSQLNILKNTTSIKLSESIKDSYLEKNFNHN